MRPPRPAPSSRYQSATHPGDEGHPPLEHVAIGILRTRHMLLPIAGEHLGSGGRGVLKGGDALSSSVRSRSTAAAASRWMRMNRASASGFEGHLESSDDSTAFDRAVSPNCR